MCQEKSEYRKFNIELNRISPSFCDTLEERNANTRYSRYLDKYHSCRICMSFYTNFKNSFFLYNRSLLNDAYMGKIIDTKFNVIL